MVNMKKQGKYSKFNAQKCKKIRLKIGKIYEKIWQLFFSYRIKITNPLQHFDVILEYFLIPLRIKITLKVCIICKELVKIERF